MTTEFVDVLIVGAGLSGISAAYLLQTHCPSKTYAILEGRETIGGTWDLFRYPGVRSDSDMFTLGYAFRPWLEGKAIADGPSILNYIRTTAEDFGIAAHIRFGQRVCGAAWSSAAAQWTVDIERGTAKELVTLRCRFLYMCTGYYEYESGYNPKWPGMDCFAGQIVHPQQWPADLDYSGKRVVVIGSGATAVTIVPAMTDKAAHVTMLQRSPTYIVPRASEDKFVNRLRKWLPARLVYGFARWQAILSGIYYYRLARSRPAIVKKAIIDGVRLQLGPTYDVETHFTPRYNPWDQRICLAADNDFFEAIKAGKASVVTDQIEAFTSRGIRLCSGTELEADLIVTATGLKFRLLSGVQLRVDGKPVELSQTLRYKGVMFSDIPNLALAFGYTNASWTLKCELIARYVCRLLNYMDRHGYTHCVPRKKDPTVRPEPALDFTSGYVVRALDMVPQQGNKHPWRLYQNYLRDLSMLGYARLNDGTLEFSRSAAFQPDQKG